MIGYLERVKKMSDKRLLVTGMTLSLDLKDLNYGAGQSRFINLKSEVPEGAEGFAPEEMEALVDQSLDMHLAMWESLQFAKYAAGEVTGTEAIAAVNKAKARIKKLREFLKSSTEEIDNP
jgi:hypothetical protein